ncbi:molybdenum cofactor guanylyltransferase [Burkholderiaceae bacterium DAT-1]|nr:molybdenum cofactor guanylyltransferase [Burkholderiaceae bacterium DAT-1]
MTTIDALILCGGLGSRMGGIDKGWLEVEGIPLVERCIASLKRQSLQPARILISANRTLPRYESLGLPILTDLRAGNPGPLAGIEAGLHAASSDWLFALPCDCPDIPDDMIEQLAKVDTTARVRHAAYHPLPCLLHQSTLNTLTAALDCGRYRVRAWQHECEAATVPMTVDWCNLNAPEDIARTLDYAVAQAANASSLSDNT